MDINLPLILFLAVVGTGVVSVFDLLFLRKDRNLRIAAVEGKFTDLTDEQKASSRDYFTSMEKVAAEPVVVEYSKSFFPVLLIVFVLRSFIIEPFQIPSESMVPTLEVGDFIAVNKSAYGVRLPLVRTKVVNIADPQRGDVMVFFPPHESRYFIKRVVGLPGDKVRYKDNTLYINDVEMKQTHVADEPAKNGSCLRVDGRYEVVVEDFDNGTVHEMRKCISKRIIGREGLWFVPEGHYFMMGDNRDNSSDSREWGFVPEDRIVGKAFAIWMHWESLFSLPSFSRSGAL
ncbi:MAG: signal peptidase I [Alteromonadaceae bacterium]|nr:MAG: signal peptidase I [Alteromonadaceae bacterium]